MVDFTVKLLHALIPVLAVATGCQDREPSLVFIEHFVERSTAVRCVPTAPTGGGQRHVGLLRTINDSLLLALYPHEREVAIYGYDLQPRHIVAYAKDGPRGVLAPEDVILVDDTLLYFADMPRRQLRIISLSGVDVGSVHADVAPRTLAHDGEVVFVVPMIMGPDHFDLLYVLQDVGDLTPVGVPILRVDSWQMETLANMTVATTFHNRIVVTHQFLRPVAYTFTHGSAFDWERSTIPLPDGVENDVGWVPEPPFVEEELMRILAPVLAAAPDLRTGDLLYLTRSGRSNGRYQEKAIVRADSDLRYLSSYILDVNAGHLAYWSDSAAAIVVDEDDEWYSCPTPPPALLE